MSGLFFFSVKYNIAFIYYYLVSLLVNCLIILEFLYFVAIDHVISCSGHVILCAGIFCSDKYIHYFQVALTPYTFL